MKETRITLPELGLVAGTRAALGAGIGLRLADCLTPEQRRAVGWTLVFFGALTTIPLAFEVLGGRVRPSHAADEGDGELTYEATERVSQWHELVLP
jgi:hypothetical protein